MKKLLGLLIVLACGIVHAQTPISALPSAATSTTGTEPFPVVQSAATKKMTLSQVAAWLVAQNLTWTGANAYSQQVTAPSLFLQTGVLLLGPVPVTGSLTGLTIGSGSTPAMGVQSLATNTGDAWFIATAQAFANICMEVNNKGSTGACGLPTGSSGISATNGALYLHSSTNTIQTDATSVPWPKVAFGGWNGVGGCIQDTQIAISGFAAGGFTCTRLGTGQYQVVPLTGQFTQPPACTVSAGSGGGGGANANSVQALEVGSSPPFIITVNMFNVSIAFQDNHFILTCMGL